MVEWSNEALEAAWNAMFVEPFDGTQAPMIGAALDAAVKAQGFEVMLWKKRKEVRAEAFEEAAKAIDELESNYVDTGVPRGLPAIEYEDGFADGCIAAIGVIRDLAKEGK